MDVSNADRLWYPFQFWVLLIFGVPSLICSLLIVYRYFAHRLGREGLHNHTVLVLILINVLIIITDVSWMLDNLRHSGRVPFRSRAFCLIWWFLDYSLYSMQTVVLSWASIERHILIFHSQYMITQRQRLFFHYLPPLGAIVYLLGFNVGVLLFPPCVNQFDFDRIECGIEPCFLQGRILPIWEKLVHHVLPTLLIALFNMALLYRILVQKKRFQQVIRWRKHRRMAMQLLSIAALYLFLNFPIMVILLVQLISNLELESSLGIDLYYFFSTYMVTLLLPFVVYFNYLSFEKQSQHPRVVPNISLLPCERPLRRNQTRNV